MIEVESNKNYTNSYFDEAYNYAKDEMNGTQWTNWNWNSSLGAQYLLNLVQV